jgi:putative FmdB family regulatory protein
MLFPCVWGENTQKETLSQPVNLATAKRVGECGRFKIPTYDFCCPNGHTFEKLQSMSAQNPRCPECDLDTTKVIGETLRPIWKCNTETPGGGWQTSKPKRFIDGVATRKPGERWKVEKHRS